MPSDADLARACSGGDRTAFGELIRRCTPMVCAVAYAATHDRALAEDVAQDTFLAAWRDVATLREPASVRPWLCRIARNLAHKERRTRVHEQLSDAIDVSMARTPFDAMHDAQVERAVAAALAAVPEPYREALVLFYFEQRSAKSVSDALGVSEDVVHKRVSRGRRYLATDLDELVERTLRRPPRRDLAGCVLALMPRRTTAKGSVMSKLALASVSASIVATAMLAKTSTAMPSSPAPHPVTVPHATASHPATRAPAPPTLPDPTDCGAVAKHLVMTAHVTDAKPERIPVTTAHLDKLCRRLAWPRSERLCILAAEDKAGVEFCRNAAEHRPGSRDAEPVTAIRATDCTTLGNHVADLMVAETEGTMQDNIEASLMLDPDELHREVREQCVNEGWADELRSCFAAATAMRQIVKCRLAYDTDEM